MKFHKKMLRLYAVTDRGYAQEKTLYEQVEEALMGGATLVQLREKEMPEDMLIAETRKMVDLCHRYQVPLIVNDHVRVAIQAGADGVHVGLEDTPVEEIRAMAGPDFIIGATAKTVEQAKKAYQSGADYLGVGAVFPSPTKSNAIRISNEQLNEICQSVPIPAVAIGGISLSNMEALTGSKIDGVAVVSAIFGAGDIVAETAKLRKMVDKILSPAKKKTALTIAGSDSGGGAGIQADLKTMQANGVYGMSAITALTAQNTTGVRSIMNVTPEFLKDQIDAVFEDIRPDAVKIGMVSSAELIDVIADRLLAFRASNIVVDPVMVATSGSALIRSDAVKKLVERLFPLASLVTPNIPEAEVLTGCQISCREDMLQAAKTISQTYGCSVLVKGGHSINDANDLLYHQGQVTWFEGKRIDTDDTHGTGCTLSSAIASNLAKGESMEVAIQKAKDYISGALSAHLRLGKGSGPMDHGYLFLKD